MSLGYRPVLFSPLAPDGVGPEQVASGIMYRWRAVHPWDAGDESGGMETQWSPLLMINGTAATRDLPITPADNGLDVEITVKTGTASGKPETRIETVLVPAGSGTIDFYNTNGADGEVLVRVDRSTLAPISSLSSAQELRLQAVETGLANVSGGASNVTAVTGISVFSRSYLDDTSGDAVLATIGGAQNDEVVHLTGSETVAGVKTFSSSPIVPTPTTSTQAAPKSYVDSAVSGVVAGSVAWADVTGKPSTFAPTLPIASSGVTGFSALEGRVTTLEGSVVPSTAQTLTWNGTTYGTYDAGVTVHEFVGPINPLQAGYTLSVYDRWREVTPVDPGNPNLVTIGAYTYALAGTNIDRGASALVRYTYDPARPVTLTNQYGVEVTISTVTNLVTAVNDRNTSGSTTGTTVAANTYVLSGHGVGSGYAGQFLLDRATVGAEVVLSTTTTPPVTPPPDTNGQRLYGMYKNTYVAAPDIRDWPSDVQEFINHIYLSMATSNATGTGQLRFNPSTGQSVADIKADVLAARNRGCNVLMAIGGSNGGGIAITNTTQADQCFASISSFRDLYGINGVDFDLEPASSTWTNEALGYLAARFKTEFGSGFVVGLTVGLYDVWTARWTSCYSYAPTRYDYMASMNYDFPEAKTSALNAVLANKSAAMLSGGVPVNKQVHLFMMQPPGQPTYNACPTAAIAYNAWNYVLALYPTLKGAGWWVDNEQDGRSWDGSRGMAPYVRTDL